MGSWDVACKSGNSISPGTKCLFFPLVPRTYKKQHIIHPASEYVSNEGAYLFFYPFSLGIIGTYADYGELEDIEENENTKAIEKYFGIKIQALLDYICHPDDNEDVLTGLDKKKEALIKSMSGMWMLQSVYDKMTSRVEAQDIGGRLRSLADANVRQSSLEELGFSEVSIVMREPHHSSLYRKEGYPYDVFWGQYGIKIVPTSERQYFVYDKRCISEIKYIWQRAIFAHAKEEYKATWASKEDVPVPLTDDFAELGALFTELTGGMTFSWAKTSYDSYSLRDFAIKWLALTKDKLDITPYEAKWTFDENYEELRQTLLEVDEQELKWMRHDALLPWPYFNDVYLDNVKQGTIKEDFRLFQVFVCNFYSANQFFFPTAHGEQFGNPRATKLWAEAILEVAEADIQAETDDAY